ncbi:MAG: hypothetical protein HYR91_02610 [Flavobacteriia bacterium]|nr:hypothetical protein [Flavobacteriia bacterium]
MKKLILLFTLFVSFYSNSQKSQFAFYLPIDIPNKNIMPNMNTAVGFGFSFGYRPVFGFPMIAEFKSSFGNYASEYHSTKVLLYNNSPATNVHAEFKSRFNKYLVGTKWLIGYDINTFRGFVTPQIGLANFRTISSYNFDDPNSQNHSGHKVVQRNLNPVYGLEIGTEIILNNIFKKKITGNTKHRLLLSVSFLQGFGNFSYCNVNNMFDVNALDHNGVVIKEESIYTALPNKYIYENYYTEVYTSKLKMWGINIGYIINLDGENKE